MANARSNMIRYAASLPVGSPERRALLAALTLSPYERTQIEGAKRRVSTKKAGESELIWAAGEIKKALDLLEDVVLTLDNRSEGESLADTYGEAAKAVADMRATSGRLANYVRQFERIAR